MSSSIRRATPWIAWPGLMLACLATTWLGFWLDAPVIGFNLTYLALAAALYALERWIPHERAWTQSDGQLLADLSHTLLSNGTIQVLIVFSSAIGLSRLLVGAGHTGFAVWPHHWPLAAQVALGLAASEFGAYWAHRIAHQWTPLWYFHAVHHSVEKLWFANSGRFHVVDALKSILPGVAILLMLGAPTDVLAWLSAITGYIGILTHCNVEMRCGLLSSVFNTPELHRWHHSRDLREGNTNYGENIVLWDQVFGTYFHATRRPPADIGIADAMPPRFRDQVAWPFSENRRLLKNRRRSVPLAESERSVDQAA